MTQKQQVLRHMERHGYITVFVAFKRYAITRLSERIRELDEDGHDIIKPRITRNGKTFSVYSLAEGRKRAA
jgi:hypothetical protein